MKIVRKEYLNEIEKWWNSNTKEALIVLGPFGVGKTTLILDWAQSKKNSYKYFAEKEYERIKGVFNKSNNNFFNFDLSLNNESSSKTSIPNLIIFDGVKPGDELLVQIKDICSKTNHKIVIISDFDEYVFKDLRFIPIGSFKKINVKPLSFKEFCSIKISNFAFKAVITSFNLDKQENIYLSDQFEELLKLYSEFGGLPNVTSILFDKGKNKAKEELKKTKEKLFNFLKANFKDSMNYISILENFVSSISSNYHRVVLSKLFDISRKTKLLKEINVLISIGLFYKVDIIDEEEKSDNFSLYFFDNGLEKELNNYTDRKFVLETIICSHIKLNSIVPVRIVSNRQTIFDFSWANEKEVFLKIKLTSKMCGKCFDDIKFLEHNHFDSYLRLLLVDNGLRNLIKKDNVIVCPIWLSLLEIDRWFI